VTRSATLPPPREQPAEPENTIQQAAGLTGLSEYTLRSDERAPREHPARDP